jgi:hypothetical protein
MSIYVWASGGANCYLVQGDASLITFQAGGACATGTTVVFASAGENSVAVDGTTFDRVLSDQGIARKDAKLGIPKPPPEFPYAAGPAGMHVVPEGDKDRILYISAGTPTPEG